MSYLSGPAMSVLRGFVAQANESYRRSGLGDYQMKVEKDGSVSAPMIRAKARAAALTGITGSSHARKGAELSTDSRQNTKKQSKASLVEVQRSGSAPQIKNLTPTSDGFELSWNEVSGAKQYGIWSNGILLGHVPSPRFIGVLSAGSQAELQVDAVSGDGKRTALTNQIVVVKDKEGKLSLGDTSTKIASTPVN